MTYIFFVLSAMFGALTQLIVFEQWERQSWLPEWVFTWDWGILSTLDAYHVYQGAWLICFGIAFFKLGNGLVGGYLASWILNTNDLFLQFYIWGYKRFGRFWRWVVVAGIVILYYQVYNAFYHIVFRFPAFWRWPIFNLG
jgi:hypothetical protein